MPDTSLVWLGSASVAVSAVLAVVEWRAHRAHQRWCRAASKTEGVVTRVSLRRMESTSDEGTAVPIVRFTAADGIDYEIDAPEAPFEPGATLEVSYDPSLPSDARVTKRVPKVGCAAVPLLAGVFLVVWGLTH